ncbi:MAG: hypothetical protein JRF02_06190 [Deltaproteobacteria bacterium]|jgi:DNA-directed RNA polymerase subunit RPC12/RpoP|nr:hypothetical protein [Deltaproteobacteria bacterium]
MKKISKLRMYYAAGSGLILAIIPTLLLLTFLAKVVVSSSRAPIIELAIYLICVLGITVWIYHSDSEFQIYYCKDCLYEWPKKKHNDVSCPKCGSRNWVYNYKP